jgi:hypothetical protein
MLSPEVLRCTALRYCVARLQLLRHDEPNARIHVVRGCQGRTLAALGLPANALVPELSFDAGLEAVCIFPCGNFWTLSPPWWTRSSG